MELFSFGQQDTNELPVMPLHLKERLASCVSVGSSDTEELTIESVKCEVEDYDAADIADISFDSDIVIIEEAQVACERDKAGLGSINIRSKQVDFIPICKVEKNSRCTEAHANNQRYDFDLPGLQDAQDMIQCCLSKPAVSICRFNWADLSKKDLHRAQLAADSCRHLRSTTRQLRDQPPKSTSFQVSWTESRKRKFEEYGSVVTDGSDIFLSADVEYLLQKIRNGQIKITDVCLSCGEQGDIYDQHPFFDGGLCDLCKLDVSTAVYVHGRDLSCRYCIICNNGGNMYVCESPGCNKVYCTSCITKYVGTAESRRVAQEPTWKCYMCREISAGLLVPKPDYKDNLMRLLGPPDLISVKRTTLAERPRLRVLSLFDGIATAKLALEKLDLDIEVYFASEIQKDAKLVARVRHPEKLQHVGDVRNLTHKKLQELMPIDLLVGGSPCNDLSAVNTSNRRGLEGSSGVLFFEFARVLNSLKSMSSPDRPLFWMFENVASMQQQQREAISRHLDCQPALWDAMHFSVMRRRRYFWGNIPELYWPMQFGQTSIKDRTLADILYPFRVALVKVIRTITTKINSQYQKDKTLPVCTEEGIPDLLWIPEIERAFGYPDHYTDVGNLSITKRLALLGVAWSVPMACHLLEPLKNYFAVIKTTDKCSCVQHSGTD